MANSPISKVMDQLRQAVLAGKADDRTDGQLLERFVRWRDEAAVSALVRRYGPMVWGVCRRILAHHHDAEDAFQATFLILVRKAASITPSERVGHCLYGVAYRTALKARATLAKRQTREKQVAEMPDVAAVTQPDLWQQLQPVLDHELSRLPTKYRLVLVLCDLEGKPRKQVARQLQIPEGTLSSRLTTARQLLAKRLARHGLALSGGTLALVLSEQAAAGNVPPWVVTATIKTATLLAAGQALAALGSKAEVAALVEGVLKSLLLTKIKAVSSVLLLLGVSCLGAAAVTYGAWGARPLTAQVVAPRQPDPMVSKSGRAGEAPKEKQPDEDVRPLIAKVLQAYGGEARLRRLHAFTEKIKDLEAFGGTSVSEYFVQQPDKLRIVTEKTTDGGKETRLFVLNGHQQWTTKNGVAVASEKPLAFWKDFVRFFGPRAMLRLHDPDHRVASLRYRGKTEVGGHRAEGLAFFKGPMARDLSLFLYFDQKTGLLLKEENNHDDTETVYEDYQTLDGFPIARKMTRSVKTRRVESQLTGKSEVLDFKVRDRLDPKLFQKP